MKLQEFFVAYGITKMRDSTLRKSGKSTPNPKYDPLFQRYGGTSNDYHRWIDKPWQKMICGPSTTVRIRIPDLYMRKSEKEYCVRYADTELESYVILPGLSAWARIKMKVQANKEDTKWLYITMKGSNRPSIQMSAYKSWGLPAGVEMYQHAKNLVPVYEVSDSFQVEALVNKIDE